MYCIFFNLLINNLFKWLNKNKDIIHPLILSSILFVFIHPFANGLVNLTIPNKPTSKNQMYYKK